MTGFLKSLFGVKEKDNVGVGEAVEEARAFRELLAEMNDVEVGEVVVTTTIMRLNMQENGFLPKGMVEGGHAYEPTLFVNVSIALAKLVGGYLRRKETEHALSAGVWLHTVRGISIPDVQPTARQIWGHLQRGIPHAPKLYDKVKGELEKPLPESRYDEFSLVPPMLKG